MSTTTTDTPPSVDPSVDPSAATGSPPATSISTSTNPTGPVDDSDSDDPDDPPIIWDCAAPPGTSHHCTGIPSDIPSSPVCDLLAQDCPEGQKCSPFSGEETIWDNSICVDLTPEPGAVGDPCTIAGPPLGGEDDCGLGLWCVPETIDSNEGICWALCAPGPADPIGCDGGTCAWLFSEWVPACVETCDPVLQDCVLGRCDQVADAFICVPTLGPGAPPPAACTFEGECETGSTCLGAGMAPDCAGGACCSSFCDALAPDPGAACPGVGNCTSWFGAGMAPAGLEHVGVCVG